ncbi:MAG: hypothetical protein ABI333_04290 [bacterium]
MIRHCPLLLPTLLLFTGCAPFVSLQKDEVFTAKKVKALQFDDACRLQSYFDKKPPDLLVMDERTAGQANANLEAGEVTLEIAKGPQLTKLGQILKRFYADVPPELLTSRLILSTSFVRRVSSKKTKDKQGKPVARRAIGVTLLPKDAKITVRVGDDRFVLAYHPCVGEFLFGRLTYKLRGQLLSPAPTPAPRARPRERARPEPRRRAARPAPRPQPEKRPVTTPPRPDRPPLRTSPLPEMPR